MTPKQISKLAKDTLKAGPVISHDTSGDGYFAYVIFVRQGLKYIVIVCDKDIVDSNEGHEQAFLESEIRAALETMESTPLSKTVVQDLPMVPP